MQFQTAASVFPVTLSMHVPEREHVWPFKSALRSEVKSRGEKDAAWQLLVDGVPVVQGRVDGATQWLHRDHTKIIEQGQKVKLLIEKNEAGQPKDVTLTLSLTAHFPFTE